MKLKEKIRQCCQILFKGRDIEKEHRQAMREAEDLAEKAMAQLELLVNSAKPSFMADANFDNVGTFHIYKARVAPYSGIPTSPTHPETLDEINFELQRVDGSYRIVCNHGEFERKMQYLYERAAHEFAKTLIQKKLLRVTPIRNSLDREDVTLLFEAMFYKQR